VTTPAIKVTSLTGVEKLTSTSDDQPMAADPVPRRLWSIGMAAQYLGVSHATVERLVLRGEIPIVKVSNATRYDVKDLDDYIEINRRRNRRRTA
jgi:excisionase family DNA binding protein